MSIQRVCRYVEHTFMICGHPVERRVPCSFLRCSFLQDGITHAWVMEFENEEDWKYYLEKEVANVDLDKEMLQYVKHAQVVDFKPDQF